MLYFVEAYANDVKLTAITDTPKKALAEAIDWHVVKRLNCIIISDGSGRYSIAEFAEMMALREIAELV